MTKQEEDILRDNRLFLGDDIGRKSFFYVREAIMLKMSQGNPTLTIHLSSNGGDVAPGRDIFDFLKYYPGKKIGVGHALVASTAAIVMQACDWRVVTPYTNVLIHSVSGTRITLEVIQNSDKMKKFVEELERVQGISTQILSSRTKKTAKQIIEICEQDASMSAEEAKEFGLIDQIIVTEADIRAPWMVKEEKK